VKVCQAKRNKLPREHNNGADNSADDHFFHVGMFWFICKVRLLVFFSNGCFANP
jgi:hypothetical protein